MGAKMLMKNCVKKRMRDSSVVVFGSKRHMQTGTVGACFRGYLGQREAIIVCIRMMLPYGLFLDRLCSSCLTFIWASNEHRTRAASHMSCSGSLSDKSEFTRHEKYIY
jgi:hypothetical protein